MGIAGFGFSVIAKRSVGGFAGSCVRSGLLFRCLEDDRRSFICSRRMASVLSASAASSSFEIALLQVSVGADKPGNLRHAREALVTAGSRGVRLAMLPECFNCPYDTKCFPEYAEPVPDVGTTLDQAIEGSSVAMLQQVAAEQKIFIVGGSIPEREGDKIYNTSISVSPEGAVVGKHRKVHLFDIDIPGGVRFKESDALSAGNTTTIFDMGECKVAVAICYDIRFPELSMMMASEGAKLLCLPGAFNMSTGPAHWELLIRSRALDNQMFVAACSPARSYDGTYTAWGHSMVCDPWGTVIAAAEETEDIVYAKIDLQRLDEVRNAIPVSKQKRLDLYRLDKVQNKT